MSWEPPKKIAFGQPLYRVIPDWNGPGALEEVHFVAVQETTNGHWSSDRYTIEKDGRISSGECSS